MSKAFPLTLSLSPLGRGNRCNKLLSASTPSAAKAGEGRGEGGFYVCR